MGMDVALEDRGGGVEPLGELVFGQGACYGELLGGIDGDQVRPMEMLLGGAVDLFVVTGGSDDDGVVQMLEKVVRRLNRLPGLVAFVVLSPGDGLCDGVDGVRSGVFPLGRL